LERSEAGRRVTAATAAVESPVPFIDLGDIPFGGPRFEIRLELGSGVTLSIARG
jgi:hypothetical protein